tara:strand:- start:980 stop:1525 length:546 start_codon:yes stop_codon:yes gene_type:complete
MADMVLGPEGFSYSGSTNNKDIGQPFYRRAGSSSNYNVGGSWTNIFQSPDWSIPKKSQLVMNFRAPIRQNTTDWGGAYIRTYYRVNSGGWVDCGNAGYTTAMGNGKYMISGHDNMQTFDFLNKTSDFTLGFLVQGTHYNASNFDTGGDHSIENADSAANTATGVSSYPWWMYMTINGWSRP